uniref:Sterile alpha and TIR motif-containing protein 1 n=1 Tax=Rodentolepis nana TaxID=102285 RepID=A0A0R3TAH4_RODNA
LQTLYGTSNINQKRYPSDNALDMTYNEEKSQQANSMMPQFYVSGRKAGTVKIAVRSRSEQTSPTNNGPSSPRQVFRVATGGGGGAPYDDRVRSQHVILPQSTQPKNTTSSSVDGPQSEDDENQTLPSVREIIRQVEEMTLKNNSSAHNSSTSLNHSHSGGSTMHISRSLSRPVNAEVPGRGENSRSLSASSAQINGGTLGRMTNHNGTYYATSSNSSDFDSHTVGRGYATTRREDFDSDNRRSAGQSVRPLFLDFLFE